MPFLQFAQKIQISREKNENFEQKNENFQQKISKKNKKFPRENDRLFFTKKSGDSQLCFYPKKNPIARKVGD